MQTNYTQKRIESDSVCEKNHMLLVVLEEELVELELVPLLMLRFVSGVVHNHSR